MSARIAVRPTLLAGACIALAASLPAVAGSGFQYPLGAAATSPTVYDIVDPALPRPVIGLQAGDGAKGLADVYGLPTGLRLGSGSVGLQLSMPRRPAEGAAPGLWPGWAGTQREASPSIAPSISWSSGSHQVLSGVGVFGVVPQYSGDGLQAAQEGLRGITPFVGYAYRSPGSGVELSANLAMDYARSTLDRSGSRARLDVLAASQIGKSWTLGLSGSLYRTLDGDPTLGLGQPAWAARGGSLGTMVRYAWTSGRRPLGLQLRWVTETGVGGRGEALTVDFATQF
jgi:hypothetical protein